MKPPTIKDMHLLKEKTKRYFLSPGAVRIAGKGSIRKEDIENVGQVA